MDPEPKTIIESLGVYLPPQTASTNEVLIACRNRIPFPLEKITGIKTRRMAGRDEFAIDLARHAIADCLARSTYLPADIDLLICCNISRYDGPNSISFEPSTAMRLRRHFGFEGAIVFDITNACAGMFTGIWIADMMIRTGAIRRGLVVSGEYITHLTETAQQEIENYLDNRMACLTLGDAGASLLLEAAANDRTGFQALDLQTFGRYSPYCIAQASDQGGMIMYTDSVNLTDVAITSGAKNAIQVLDRAGWPADSFDHLIMHQTSTITLNSARQEINRLIGMKICHDGNTVNNLEQRGNTASTSHFIALADRMRNHSINAGDRIVFSVSASGLTIGTALYVLDDLPDRFRQHPSSLSSAPRAAARRNAPSTKPDVPRIRIEGVGTSPIVPSERNTSMDALIGAASGCLEKSKHAPRDIGLLIYSGVYRTGYLMEPAYAALLAGELDINAVSPPPGSTKTLAFDVFNGSVGFLNACHVAQQFIVAGKGLTAMIVAAECENNTDTISEQRVGVREVASALILDADPLSVSGFSRFFFAYHPESLEAYTSHYSPWGNHPHLHVEKAANLEAIYIDCIVPAVHTLLKAEGLEADRIDLVLPPQMSSGFIARLAEALQLPGARFIDIAGDGPDFFTSSLPYALAHVRENGLATAGDIGILIAVGSGIQVGCAVYHF